MTYITKQTTEEVEKVMLLLSFICHAVPYFTTFQVYIPVYDCEH